MVVKKKRTYKKQKGGLLILPHIPEKLINYFNFTIDMITFYDTPYIKETSNDEYITMIIEKIKNVCCDNQFNIYILNLSKTLIEILSRYFKDSLYKITIESFVKAILYNLFINETKIFRNLSSKNEKNFENNLIAIFINMLFIEHIQSIPNMMIYINKLLLNFHLEFRDNEDLMYLIKRMFLEQYPICYGGVPVFYGNTINETKNLGYNQFICKKVGISSKEKRNYIINPVGAFIHQCIYRMNLIEIYKRNLKILISKILRINSVTENKINNDFQELPKLKHLTDTSKFCIKKNAKSNIEIIVQLSTISECSKVYGCSLTMTPVIRDENIASDEHILELLLILLEVELNKQHYGNLYSYISNYPIPNQRRHGSALSQIQKSRPKIQKEQITLNNEYDIRYHDEYFELFQKEAYEVINKIKNNTTDIPKIQKLLKIIKDIENKVYPRNRNTEYYKIIIPAIIYYLSEKLKLRLSYLEKNNRARSSGNFSLYNNIKPEQLLEENYNNTILNKRLNGSVLSPIQEFDRRLESDEMDEIQGRQREMNNRARYFRNFSLYNNLSPKQLLATKDYKTILDKLYKEASILTKNNRRYNSKDIPKINNLLEIINEIGKNRSKMHNFHEDLRQALINRLNNLS
jgi:hypothetical protein